MIKNALMILFKKKKINKEINESKENLDHIYKRYNLDL